MNKRQSGMITIEACITLLVFILLMLMLSSLFVMFMAQNTTAHALLQTTQSLSTDAYAANQYGEGGLGSVKEAVVLIVNFIKSLFGNEDDNPAFTLTTQWYTKDNDTIVDTVRDRFIAYVSGAGEEDADELLENLNIVDGADGLDFSGSYIENDILYVVLKYELEYDFNIFDMGIVDVEQSACAKLWK